MAAVRQRISRSHFWPELAVASRSASSGPGLGTCAATICSRARGAAAQCGWRRACGVSARAPPRAKATVADGATRPIHRRPGRWRQRAAAAHPPTRDATRDRTGGSVRTYATPEELPRDYPADVVCIATYPGTHLTLTRDVSIALRSDDAAAVSVGDGTRARLAY